MVQTNVNVSKVTSTPPSNPTLHTRASEGEIDDLEPTVKDKLIFLANAIIRDAKTGKAYAH